MILIAVVLIFWQILSMMVDTEVPTLEKFFKTAMEPVGSTMYVWGGGWNEEDTGASIEAVTIGVSERWAEFAAQQTASYDYQNTLYQIHDGLDCSGYVGWVVYNTMNTRSDQEGYVTYASEMPELFAGYGWGTYNAAPSDFKPGDIMANDGHVYIVLGTCSDGSVLLVHSSPPGVRLCGTDIFSTGSSEAITLADTYMQEHHPEWTARYPDCKVDTSYMNSYVQFRWNTNTFPDAETLQSLSAAEIIQMALQNWMGFAKIGHQDNVGRRPPHVFI